MEKVVSDASIIVKWFIDEEYSDRALKLRDMHVNGEVHIVAPELMPFEVLNALRYSGLFTVEEIKLAANSLLSYGIGLYPLDMEFAEETVEIALSKDVTIYDAAYLALARKLKVVFYTADKDLIKKFGEEYAEIAIHVSRI